MAVNRRLILMGALVCAVGLWLVLRPWDADTSSTGVSAGGRLTSEQIDDPDQVQADDSAGIVVDDARSGGGEAEPSASASTDADSPPTGDELASLSLERLPVAVTAIEEDADGDCDRRYAGLGVELRAWGDVLVPYTPGYPTSEPGEVWDCTADTVFGGAIAMTHAAYLEALRPDLIPVIASDTPGREARIDSHPGGNPSASLGFSCSPVGWNWDGEQTWSLLHQCGEGDLRVSYYPMEHHDGRWWLVYPGDGVIETGPPPTGYEYYPFLGGD